MSRTEPARGMRDYLPEDIRRREYVIGVIRRVYERYGFEPLETPAVENLETLMGKYGEEGNQLIFKILKRGEHEASGQADLALRYDLTVPLSRVVAHYQSKLPRLFKRYQIQPVWRADRPARGRFREFYQCDVDALGSTSPAIEAEVCAAVSDALSELGIQRLHDPHQPSAAVDVDPNAAGIPRSCTGRRSLPRQVGQDRRGWCEDGDEARGVEWPRQGSCSSSVRRSGEASRSTSCSASAS